MQAQQNESETDAWARIEPLLEQAMAQLGEKDHSAIVLRFFQRRNFKEVSAAHSPSVQYLRLWRDSRPGLATFEISYCR